MLINNLIITFSVILLAVGWTLICKADKVSYKNK